VDPVDLRAVSGLEQQMIGWLKVVALCFESEASSSPLVARQTLKLRHQRLEV